MTSDIYRSKTGGIRPFDPYRDLGAVTDLIAEAFAGQLDATAQSVLSEMRRLARWGVLFAWSPLWDGNAGGISHGFVWVEGRQVVGNVSLRRASEPGGYLIGNVAVLPAWRRRGIAFALMKAALDAVAARGGRWAGLEVEDSNTAALALYQRLGFCEVGRTVTLHRAAGQPPGARPSDRLALRLRRASGSDSKPLAELARRSVPEAQRPFLDVRPSNYRLDFERWLSSYLVGRREVWWVAEVDGYLKGAVRALKERGKCPNRLDVLIAPECTGRFERSLVWQGLTGLRGFWRNSVEATVVESASDLIVALEEFGFRRSRVLIQMRLPLDTPRSSPDGNRF